MTNNKRKTQIIWKLEKLKNLDLMSYQYYNHNSHYYNDGELRRFKESKAKGKEQLKDENAKKQKMRRVKEN